MQETGRNVSFWGQSYLKCCEKVSIVATLTESRLATPRLSHKWPRVHDMMGAPAGFNPWDPLIFDLTREFVLTYPTPTIQVTEWPTVSTTPPVFRLHWNTLEEWRDFGDRVIEYWNNTVTPNDKQSFVSTQGEYVGRYRGASWKAAMGGNVKSLYDDFITAVQDSAANGRNNAHLPSDRHSRLQRGDQGVEANALAGIPDCVMVSDFGYPRRFTAVIEIRDPWRVTPDLVDQVIQSILPLIL
jgi:hypothetical protein